MMNSIYSQSQTNALAASQVPLPRKPNEVLGGGEKVVDETGEKVKEDFLHFLNHFSENRVNTGDENTSNRDEIATSELLDRSTNTEEVVYISQLNEMRKDGQNTLYVDFVHIYRYNEVLANAIAESYYRFEPFLRTSLKNFVAIHAPNYLRLPNSNQERDFWVSIYGMTLIHKYTYKL